jgi:hypothetical protein
MTDEKESTSGDKPEPAKEKVVYPARPIDNPDFEQIRRDAMRRFAKTRARLREG